MSKSDLIGDYEFKSFDGVYWLKIFYHNCQNGQFFTKTDVYNITTEDKYSILYILDKNFTIRDKFEFLLEYPELGKFNHWRQKNSPTKEKEILNADPYKVQGYEGVKIQMNNCSWGGLALSTTTNTLIEGSIGKTDNWYYAIGQYADDWLDLGKIAANQPVNYVYLWLGLRQLFYFTCSKKIRLHYNTFSSIILLCK